MDTSNYYEQYYANRGMFQWNSKDKCDLTTEYKLEPVVCIAELV